MKKIDRVEAEKIYADWIIDHGNPHYFVYKVINKWDSYELAEHMQEALGEEFEVVEEE